MSKNPKILQTSYRVEDISFEQPCTVLVLRMSHRKWKETKQLPGTAESGNMLGCCLVSFHFLWAILSTSTVYGSSLVRSILMNLCCQHDFIHTNCRCAWSTAEDVYIHTCPLLPFSGKSQKNHCNHTKLQMTKRCTVRSPVDGDPSGGEPWLG